MSLLTRLAQTGHPDRGTSHGYGLEEGWTSPEAFCFQHPAHKRNKPPSKLWTLKGAGHSSPRTAPIPERLPLAPGPWVIGGAEGSWSEAKHQSFQLYSVSLISGDRISGPI